MTQKPTLTRKILEKAKARVAAGEIDLRDVGKLLFGNWDQDDPAALLDMALAYLDMVPVPAKDFKDGSWLLAWSKGELSESRPCTWNKKKKAWCDLPDEDRIEGFEPDFCIPLLALPTPEGET